MCIVHTLRKTYALKKNTNEYFFLRILPSSYALYTANVPLYFKLIILFKQKNPVAFSPQVNYTD
jgi:hypothetical protein